MASAASYDSAYDGARQGRVCAGVGVRVCGLRPAEGRARREPGRGDVSAPTRATDSYSFSGSPGARQRHESNEP